MRIPLAITLLLTACATDDLAPDDIGEATGELNYIDSASIPVTGPVAAFRGDDYNVQVVGLNGSGVPAWDIQSGGAWGAPNFTALGPPYMISPPPAGLRHLAAAQQQDGKTLVFAYTSGALYYTKQLTAYGRSWSAWTYVGPAAAAPASIERNQDGRLEVVYLGSDGYVRQLWQGSVNSSLSSPYNTGVASSRPPKIHKDLQGRLEIFVPIASGTCGLKHWRQLAANGWSGWTAPVLAAQGFCLRDVAVGHQGGRTEIVARTTSNSPVRIMRPGPDLAFQFPSSMSYSAPYPPAVQLKDDGRLVFFLWLDGTGGVPVSHAVIFAEMDTNGFLSYSALPFHFSSMSEVRAAESLINVTEVYVQGTRYRGN